MQNCNCQDRVNEFTQATGEVVPPYPQLMTRKEVEFMIRMVLSEMQELANTVTNSEKESVELLHKVCDEIDISTHKCADMSEVEKVAEQADALVDANYYMLNIAGRNGHNLSKVFDAVHQANMNKIDKETGMCKKREDGKILKPAGWKPPDIVAEIYKLGYPKE